MDVQLEQTGTFGRKLSITIPAPEVEKAFDGVAKAVSKEARIPGFRQGKIPRELLEKHYGQQIRAEVRDRLLNEKLVEALESKQLSPVAVPHVHLDTLERGKPFTFTAEFDIQPEVKLGSYKGLKVATVKVEVTDAEIDGQLDGMRKQAAQLVPVLVRDTVEKGDMVLIDYEGTIGGVPFQGGKAENAYIEVGGDGYLPQFSEALEGAKVPGERIFPVDFPADYGAKELAGKGASFTVKLKEIKRKELPALDDEFAKDVGVDTLAALRERVKQSLETQKKRDAETEQRRLLIEALVAANPFEIPASMVDQQAERMVESAQARVAQMVGRNIELSAEERDNLRKENQSNAELQVRGGLLMLEVAKAEKLTVDTSEVDAEIEQMAKAFGADAPRLSAHYRDPETRDRLRYRLLEEKVVKFLLDQAEKSDGPATPA
jgi:trigger factor